MPLIVKWNIWILTYAWRRLRGWATEKGKSTLLQISLLREGSVSVFMAQEIKITPDSHASKALALYTKMMPIFIWYLC